MISGFRRRANEIAPFWDFMHRRMVITDVSGQPISPVFKGQAVILFTLKEWIGKGCGRKVLLFKAPISNPFSAPQTSSKLLRNIIAVNCKIIQKYVVRIKQNC